MFVSGSVGYTLLKHKSMDKSIDKYVLVLADVHDGVSYCSQDSLMIDQFLNNNSINNEVLLEELFREKLNTKDLWPSSLHTQKLKQLNYNNPNIKPIDLRPMLLPFSWELSEISTELSQMTLSKYIEGIDNFLNKKNTKLFYKYILPEIRKLKDKEKFRVSLITHFNEINEIFNEYKQKYNKYMDVKIIDLYNMNQNVLELINNILSMIMEWFILVCIHNSEKNTIIHLGLAHSDRIIELLTQVYQFKQISNIGINKIDDIKDNPKSCIFMGNIPDTNMLKYKNKYFLEIW
jgi:hypothetical protein